MKKTSPGATNNLTGKQTASLPITGVVLCGGRATRMQGQDKGLLSYQGIPMVNYAIQAFAPCQQILINANRNHAIYHELTGLPVKADSIGGFAGPLAGIHTAMQSAEHDWIISCPCDCPHIDQTYVLTMWQAHLDNQQQGNKDTLIYVARDDFRQPVFALIHTSLQDKLQRFLETAEHKKIILFYQQIGYQWVQFTSGQRFTNINSISELQ